MLALGSQIMCSPTLPCVVGGGGILYRPNKFLPNSKLHCIQTIPDFFSYTSPAGSPLTYFNDGGWGVGVIYLGLKFWPKVIFWGLP